MKITKGTVIRTIVLLAALLNQALSAFGKSPLPFSDEDITQIVSLLFTSGAAITAWWKNNSFTGAAIEADNLLRELKE